MQSLICSSRDCDTCIDLEGLSAPGAKKSSDAHIIEGAAAGGFLLLLLLLFAGVYAFRQKKRAEKATDHSNPFGKIRI